MIEEKKVKELIRKMVKETKSLTEEELKEKFIASFGEDKWIEEEMLSKLIPLSIEVSSYLEIDFLPIIFEELDEEDARIYYEEDYIAINTKYKDNYLECSKCITHELRHVYQAMYAATRNDNRAKAFKEELANPAKLNPKDPYSITKYCMQAIEIDSFAFTKWYLKIRLGIEVIHPSTYYEAIICTYIEKYL